MCCLLAAIALALLGAGRWLSTLVGKSEEAVPRIALVALLIAGIVETVVIVERLMEPRDAGVGRVAGLPLCRGISFP